MGVKLLDERIVVVIEPAQREANDIRLVKQGILKEEEIESGKNITGPVCQIRNDLIEFDQLPDRLVFKIKQGNAEEYANRVRKMIKAGFPITAIGINFIYFLDTDSPVKKLEEALAPQGASLKKVLAGNFEFGIFSRKSINDDYTCGITIERGTRKETGEDREGIGFQINYDKREFESLDILGDFANKFEELKDAAKKMVGDLAEDLNNAAEFPCS